MSFVSGSVVARTVFTLSFFSAAVLGLSMSGVLPETLSANANGEVRRAGEAETLTTMSVGVCESLAGGVVEVEGTGGSGIQPTGYPTLTAAFAAINAGTHTGAVTVEICGSTSEAAAPAVVNSSGAGSASYTSINIHPLIDAAVVSGPTGAGRGLIELNGADNVIIDGDNPLTAGTNRNMTVQNTAASTITHASVIRIAMNPANASSADNCTFRNLSLLGSATGGNTSGITGTGTATNVSYGIYAGGGASGETSAPNPNTATAAGSGATAANLTIQNNAINTAGRGIVANGSAQTVFPGLNIASNDIGNPTAGSADQVYSMGVTIQGSASATVRGNTIFVESYLATAIRGIDLGSLSSSGANALIEKNRVLRVRNNHPQTHGAYGINLQGGNNHIVQNNFIAEVRNDQTTGGNSFSVVAGSFGIRAQTGTGHDILHNSVNLSGSIPGTTGSTLSAAFMINASGNTGLDVRNNIFSNQLGGGNPSGTRHAAIYLPAAVGTSLNLNLNNNAYYQGSDANSRLAQTGDTFGTGEFLAANFSAAAITPASNLRSYTSGLSGDESNDNASLAPLTGPPFVSNTDLHISGGAVLESAGANVGVADDIDGQARSLATPDIGADEFVGVAPNQPPVINSVAPTLATEDILLTYNATRTDADGPGQTWSLLGTHTCGGSIVAGTGVFTFTAVGPVPSASCVLAIQVCDGGSPNLCAQQSTTVNITAVNDPPTITSSAPTTATEDLLYTYNATFSDPDGTGSTWELVAPTHTCGGSINGSGVFTFTPAGPVPATSCVVAVRVCDNSPSCSPTQSTTVTISAVNDPPVAVDDNQNTTMNVPLVVNGSVLTSNDVDPEMQPLTVTAVGNPVNGTVGLSAGVVTFTPTAAFTGAASFEYTVSDGSLTDVGVVNVTVAGAVFSGVMSIGAGQTYDSLTNNGGLFQALNAGTISGNVVVNIVSDMTAETGTHALNQLTETGIGGYSVFFQASGGPRLIEGSNGDALITLNGADRITFSGLAFGPYGVRFRNTGNGSTIRLINDASNNSILNCQVEGQASGSFAVVDFGDGMITGNDNNEISGNLIRDRTDSLGVPNFLIRDRNSSPGMSDGFTISNNELANFLFSGIESIGDDSVISGNLIHQTANRPGAAGAIRLFTQDGTVTVTGNVIRDVAYGISIFGNGTALVSSNRIFTLNFETFVGVFIQQDTVTSVARLENNMLSLLSTVPSGTSRFGVMHEGSLGQTELTHNSILLEGPATGGENAAFFHSSGGGPGTSQIDFVLTNNIFFNGISGPGEHYSVDRRTAGPGSFLSDYNIYVGKGSTAGNFFNLEGTPVDFASWQAGPPTRDAGSIASPSNVGPFNVGNMFASPSDLHLRTIGNNPAINAAGPSGVTVDFDGQTRPFNGLPDIGADEVQTVPTAADALIGGRVVTADGRGIRNVRVLVTGGDLSWPRPAITNAFGYFVIDGLRAGETYLVSVSGKHYVFDTQVQLVSLGENALDINFVGVAR